MDEYRKGRPVTCPGSDLPTLFPRRKNRSLSIPDEQSESGSIEATALALLRERKKRNKKKAERAGLKRIPFLCLYQLWGSC
jgi:hypothetical protein